MEHILTDCGTTEDAVEEALTAVEMIRGEQAGATVESRLQAAFREIGYENESERKVHKVMGKLHDDIRRVLSDQRSAIQTHEALPMCIQVHHLQQRSEAPRPSGPACRRNRQNSVSL